MTELFKVEGKPVKGGDRLYHNALAPNVGERWVEVLKQVDALNAQVRVVKGSGKGAVPVILIANLRWEEPATEKDLVADLYDRLSNGPSLALEALALLRTQDMALQQAAEREQLLSEQHELLTRCQTQAFRLSDDLLTGISNAVRSFRNLFAPTRPGPPAADLFPIKGSGNWHVAVLEDRIWRDVSGAFPSKFKARMWALDNEYTLTSTDQPNGALPTTTMTNNCTPPRASEQR